MKNQVNPSQSASKFEDGVDYSKPSKDRPFFLYVDHLNVYVSEKAGREYMREYWLEKREEELSHRCLVPSERYGIKRCREDCSKCPLFGTNHGNGGTVSLDTLFEDYEYEAASSDESPEEYAIRRENSDALHKEIDAFKKVAALKSASLVDTALTTLNEGVFSYCKSLTSIALPSAMTSLASKSLAYTGLTSFTLGEKMTFASDAFEGDEDLSVTSLNPDVVFDVAGHFYFDKASAVLNGNVGNPSSFTAPATLTSVSSGVLKESSALTKADFSAVASSALSIGSMAFMTCKNLTEIVWPATTPTTLGTNCFSDTGIKTLVIPSNVSIDGVTGAFMGCANLESADLTSASGAYLSTAFLASCPKLASVKLSSALTHIGQMAFYSDAALTSLLIPSSVTTIDATAFSLCSSDLKLYLGATSVPSGYASGWNTIKDSAAAEYLLYSETEPDYATAGAQRYWHYDASKNPVIWAQA